MVTQTNPDGSTVAYDPSTGPITTSDGHWFGTTTTFNQDGSVTQTSPGMSTTWDSTGQGTIDQHPRRRVCLPDVHLRAGADRSGGPAVDLAAAQPERAGARADRPAEQPGADRHNPGSGTDGYDRPRRPTRPRLRPTRRPRPSTRPQRPSTPPPRPSTRPQRPSTRRRAHRHHPSAHRHDAQRPSTRRPRPSTPPQRRSTPPQRPSTPPRHRSTPPHPSTPPRHRSTSPHPSTPPRPRSTSRRSTRARRWTPDSLDSGSLDSGGSFDSGGDAGGGDWRRRRLR